MRDGGGGSRPDPIIPKTIVQTVKNAPLLGNMLFGRPLYVQAGCIKGQLVYGTLYGDMHYKDLLGSINGSNLRFPRHIYDRQGTRS